jgi:hypothetical protein
METTPLNVYVLGDFALVVNGLKHKVVRKFGSAVGVSGFCDYHQCLKKVDNLTHVVVVDGRVDGREFAFIAREIRAINPGAEVILHDSSDNVLRELSFMLRQRLVPEAAAVFALV